MSMIHQSIMQKLPSKPIIVIISLIMNRLYWNHKTQKLSRIIPFRNIHSIYDFDRNECVNIE